MKHLAQNVLSLVAGGCDRCRCEEHKKNQDILEQQESILVAEDASDSDATDVLPELSV